MNERSSRSHTIFTMAIESRARDGEEGDGAVKISALVGWVLPHGCTGKGTYSTTCV